MNNANMVNDNFGFYEFKGHKFHTVQFPTGDNASPPVDQLLGINDHDVAVGFYTNGQGSNRGYTFNIRTKQFTRVLVPGYPTGTAGPSLTAAAISNHGDIAGIYTDKNGNTDAFLDYKHGPFRTLEVLVRPPPRHSASMTTTRWSATTPSAPAPPPPAYRPGRFALPRGSATVRSK